MLFGKKKKETPFVTAIVAAGGSSRRMGGENKLMMELDGIPVLGWTLMALEACPDIREIVVAAPEEHIVTYADLGASLSVGKLTNVVKGGASRLESVYRAALQCSEKTEFLAVHDGARPFVTPEIVEKACKAAFLHNAAAAAVSVHDTIKEVDEQGRILRTVDRSNLRAMQTPQVGEKTLLLAALQNALDEGEAITDECAALERMGVHPVLIEGSFENIKITTPADLIFAQAILDRRNTK